MHSGEGFRNVTEYDRPILMAAERGLKSILCSRMQTSVGMRIARNCVGYALLHLARRSNGVVQPSSAECSRGMQGLGEGCHCIFFFFAAN